MYDRYGPPDVLRVEHVPVPSPERDQVLVEVVATSVNLSDWECLRGTPLYARLGDEVYGDNLALMGGFAEYAVAAESALAPKPAGLTFAQAATLPQSGAIALQGTAGGRRGQRMLINGAGGGTGAFAVQLAKRAGLHVTGDDNAGKLEFMRSAGADEVIDYRRSDFTRGGPYDRSTYDVSPRRVDARALLRVLTIGADAGRVTGRRLGVLVVKQGPAHFQPLADQCVRGDIRIHIDRTFDLDGVPEALARVGTGLALGKVVVEVWPAG